MTKSIDDITELQDCFCDLRTLSKRSCLSVRTLRGDLKDPENPLPHYRKGGKVLVRWSEFCQWMDNNYRQELDNYDDKIDAVVARFTGGS